MLLISQPARVLAKDRGNILVRPFVPGNRYCRLTASKSGTK